MALINGDLAMAAKVNMVGHGDGSAHIEAKDGLLDFNEYGDAQLKVKSNNKVYPKPANEQFDIVISNPPFSITVDRDTAKKFPDIFIQGEKIAHSLKKDSKKQEIDTENLFIERWYQFLKPKGRLGVVLPESVFDTTTNREIRLYLYKHFYIKAVVSLPHLAFAPYTMTKTSLLFAQKKTAEEIKKWDEFWTKYEAEYKDFKSHLKNLLDAKKKRKEDEKKKTELISILKTLLKDNFNTMDESLSVNELIDKYEEEIKQADLEWWVFGKVASTEGQNYPIFMAHADEIGYKRGTNKEEKRSNELFNTKEANEQQFIIIDTSNPTTVLDHLRKMVNWS
ncbi:MAG TPA: N-6 DNA methylase [Nitrospinota bacterium]|nr:N-6 DNA methylase [Nitrospinota bacterium]